MTSLHKPTSRSTVQVTEITSRLLDTASVCSLWKDRLNGVVLTEVMNTDQTSSLTGF